MHKDELYVQIQDVVFIVSCHVYLIILCDLNAEVGINNTRFELDYKHAKVGARNENGDRFQGFYTKDNRFSRWKIYELY